MFLNFEPFKARFSKSLGIFQHAHRFRIFAFLSKSGNVSHISAGSLRKPYRIITMEKFSVRSTENITALKLAAGITTHVQVTKILSHVE